METPATSNMETPATNNMETPTTSAGQDSFGPLIGAAMSQWETTVIRARHSANVVKAGHALSPKPRNLLPPTPSSNAPKSVPVSYIYAILIHRKREKYSLARDTKTEGDSKTYALKSPGAGMAICRVGEGYTCVITKITGPDAGKTFVECGGGCTCVINGP
ncbi:hypothetical protein CK203_017264 [Vitis vinifera]|uniref:Uncharacterized protein n=1 Tax=Vitis vinifera TaxID=29760 RepID=A0A438JZH3_VITVI|nr:hypothetical protein CK203_017264 [Vitis vinifera]